MENIQTKTCIQCLEIKNAGDFYIKHNKPAPECKECTKTRIKAWRQRPEVKTKIEQQLQTYYLEHKEEINTQNKAYRQTHKNEIKQQKHAYYEEHKDETAKTLKIYSEKHKEEIKQYKKEYRETHREELNAKQRAYEQEHKEELRIKRNERLKIRRKNDILFRLRTAVSSNIHYNLKSNGSSKKGESCLKYLPYTIEELKNHLESLFSHPENLDNGKVWMNFENHGVYRKNKWDENNSSTWKWQIDHIFPQSDFPYTSMEDDNFKLMWSLDNLRPLNAKDNWSDGINRTRHKKDKK